MGFYGNVANTSKSQFVFDKTYQNRKQMEENIKTDNIYIGRYVLVDYDLNFPGKNYARLYVNKGLYYFSPNFEDATLALSSSKKYYTYDEQGNITGINPEKQGEDTASQSWQYYTLYDGEPVYIWDDTNQLEIFYSANYDENSTLPIFELMEAPSGEITSSNFYHENYLIDQNYYGVDAIGRGWDSTVWQKVYADNKEKYVMVAELNSVVPTFGVTVDPPTLLPLTPHFDADSSSLYYNLHVQPNWGFRVANYEELSDSDKEKYGSDTNVKHRGMNYDAELNSLTRSEVDYKGTIYYNKAGFDSDYRNEKSVLEDEISVKPTGKSGITYPNSHNGNSAPEKFSDIQELYINLPSLGNAVSDVWDIIYGTGQETATEGVNKRNKTIAWDSYSGDRLVKESADGYNYMPEKTETVAGVINSVHDLMGMIIIEDDGTLEAENALSDHIYYRNNEDKFYIKDLTYTFTESDSQNAKEVENLLDFNDKDYYYRKKNNYYIANDYQTGATYYTLSNITEAFLSDEEYRPNTYYYKNGNDYILDSRIEPEDGIEYYKVSGEFDLRSPAVNHVDKYFYPSDETYYNTMFGERTKLDSNNKEERAGLFKYVESDEKPGTYLLVPFSFDEDYALIGVSKLVWWTKFEYETKAEAGDNTASGTVRVYKEDSGDKTIIQCIPFVANTYFYFNEENNSYEYLNNLANAKAVKYYRFNDSNDSIDLVVGEIDGNWVSFYKPNKYYYLENKNYIFAEEDLKLKDLNYYIFADNSINLVNETFYEPNKYYYLENGQYVLDTEPSITDGRTYFKIYDLYVMEDENGVYAEGQKWTLAEKPTGVKLGNRYEKYYWKKLEGFAHNLNTIHGLILKINQILKTGDKLTRDTSTIQGCINQLNDIINKFDALAPNQLALVNTYGQVVSGPIEGDNWIETSVNDGKVGVKLTHASAKVVESEQINQTPSFGDSFVVTNYTFDNTGHISNTQKYNITIPEGSCTTTSGVNGQTVITEVDYTKSTGAIAVKCADLGEIEIASGETLNERLETLQSAISDEGNARNDLNMAENSSTTQFISNISQTNGKVSVERSDAGTLVLGSGYTIATEKADIGTEDSLNTAFGKVQYNLNNLATSFESYKQDIEPSITKISNLDEDNLVLKNTEFSYNISEDEVSSPVTISDLFEYIGWLESRIATLENATSEG